MMSGRRPGRRPAWRRGANVGIVAFCPQGHRVKVKDHLAGKKGVCPTCGTRFRIPLESVPEPIATLPLAAVVPLDAAVVASLPRVLIADPASKPDRVAARSVPSASAAGRSVGTSPGASPETARASAQPLRHAVLDEQPDLLWSTAVPGGVASAPMPAADLRIWLESGQIIGTELVWRTDWDGWRPVGEVFPDAKRAGSGS